MSVLKLKRWEILPSTGSHFDMLDGPYGIEIFSPSYQNRLVEPQLYILLPILKRLRECLKDLALNTAN
jgi:hypothetical protein